MDRRNDKIYVRRFRMLNLVKGHKIEDFFELHEIERVDNFVTAWDTFSQDTPGQSERYDFNGKTVFDLPEELKEWGIYRRNKNRVKEVLLWRLVQ